MVASESWQSFSALFREHQKLLNGGVKLLSSPIMGVPAPELETWVTGQVLCCGSDRCIVLFHY